MNIDVNKVVDKLVNKISKLQLENVILQTQIEMLCSKDENEEEDEKIIKVGDD